MKQQNYPHQDPSFLGVPFLFVARRGPTVHHQVAKVMAVGSFPVFGKWNKNTPLWWISWPNPLVSRFCRMDSHIRLLYEFRWISSQGNCDHENDRQAQHLLRPKWSHVIKQKLLCGYAQFQTTCFLHTYVTKSCLSGVSEDQGNVKVDYSKNNMFFLFKLMVFSQLIWTKKTYNKCMLAKLEKSFLQVSEWISN